MKLVLATKNPGKLREIKSLAVADSLTWLKLELAPDNFSPIESGHTFVENALIKAKEAAHLTNAYAVADDSGIAVDALGGRPGVYSARYAEDEYTACLKLMDELKNVPSEKRTAAYHCVMILVSANGETLCQAEGLWRGRIIEDMRGNEGFGYDPIFYLDDCGKTVAEISLAEKNELSHRAKAWRQIEKYLLTHQSSLDSL
jgi:XTP/dITP diphosphohydrolase